MTENPDISTNDKVESESGKAEDSKDKESSEDKTDSSKDNVSDGASDSAR